MTVSTTKVINFRAPAAKQALIDCAAQALGKNRTDFILDTLTEKAHEVLADQTRFALSPEEFDRFNQAIEAPLSDPAALRKLLRSRAPWES